MHASVHAAVEAADAADAELELGCCCCCSCCCCSSSSSYSHSFCVPGGGGGAPSAPPAAPAPAPSVALQIHIFPSCCLRVTFLTLALGRYYLKYSDLFGKTIKDLVVFMIQDTKVARCYYPPTPVQPTCSAHIHTYAHTTHAPSKTSLCS